MKVADVVMLEGASGTAMNQLSFESFAATVVVVAFSLLKDFQVDTYRLLYCLVNLIIVLARIQEKLDWKRTRNNCLIKYATVVECNLRKRKASFSVISAGHGDLISKATCSCPALRNLNN